MQHKPQLILADDNQLFRQSMKTLLTARNMATVVGEVSNGFELIELVLILNPEIVLMDIDMPLMDGIAATRNILRLKPDLKIIAFTMYDEKEFIFQMKELGARGFILKSCDIEELDNAISEVMMGKTYFYKDIKHGTTVKPGNHEYVSKKVKRNHDVL